MPKMFHHWKFDKALDRFVRCGVCKRLYYRDQEGGRDRQNRTDLVQCQNCKKPFPDDYNTDNNVIRSW